MNFHLVFQKILNKKGKYSKSTTVNLLSKSIVVASLLFLPFLGQAQNFTGLLNPEASLTIKNESPWSYSFGTAYRNSIYSHIETDSELNKKLKFNGQFLEFNHYTNLQVASNHKFSAGIRYRFIETFTGKENETRFIEQYTYSKKYEGFKIAHRIRLAQRLREKTTFRTRYRFSVTVPLSGENVDSKKISLVNSAEGVWEFGSDEIANFGVRYSTYFGFEIFENTNFNLGLEYRYRNFTQDPYTQLFLVSSLKISI